MRYIGSKVLLLENIKQVIDEKVRSADTFCDIFSGTASVGRYFKQWFEVYSNDLLYFSYVLQMGTIKNDSIPTFQNLSSITQGSSPVAYFNEMPTQEMESLEQSKRFFQNNYSPAGGRMYITDDNALRVDYARNTIENWRENDLITVNEYYYLVACVLEGIPFISNISGTYGAYHKDWDRRAFKQFELFPLEVYTNGRNNQCFNEDGVALLERLSGDILYVDPPYNSRQYLPNYHVLETAAKYDDPVLRGVTGQREYEGQKSEFCNKQTVKKAFSNLMESSQFKHIIFSYNSDGLMSVEDIETIMKQYGEGETYQLYEIPYRRYKSRDLTMKHKLHEYLFYIEK